MNTPLRSQKYAGLITGAVMVAAIFSYAQSPKANTAGRVEIGKDRIIMHPTVNLSASDEQKLNDVVKKYDKQLYRIDTWQNGKVIKTDGTASILAKFDAEIATAQSKGAGHHSHRFACPNMGCPDVKLTAESSKMLGDLKPILQHYQ